MKNIKVFLKLFLIGFVLAFMMTTLTQCPQENPTGPIDEPAVETESIKQFSSKIITAFESGNKQNVLDLMYDEYKEIYSKDLEDAPEKMPTFAEALKNRKVIFANELYAEYELTIDGTKFTISYSNEGNGNWKIERF